MKKIELKTQKPARFMWLFFAISLFLIAACTQKKKTTDEVTEETDTSEAIDELIGVTHPEWSYDKNIYEVNIRQYSEEGNFAGFEKHLPRLKEMGVDILWFMPIHPIGEKKRKGELGSYYAVKDYLAVNPEFGTMEEFKALVKKIHDMDMYIILDWVANHTAWDNPLIEEHPEWYTTDSLGNIIAPVEDWSDVADLNYDNFEMRKYMVDALKFWVEEADIDGYRCDVAGMVPNDFWVVARDELDKIKPVFMLAEWDEPELHMAFDMTYAWGLMHTINQIAEGKKNAMHLDTFFIEDTKKYEKEHFRMLFTSNHDENSWNGTVYERYGDGAKTFAVLTATAPGMPLIYSGQEAGLDKRLEFFEQDVINWDELPLENFYKKLLALKKNNKALWNGEKGGDFNLLETTSENDVFAFLREKEDNRIFVILNLSDKPQQFTLAKNAISDTFTELFSDEQVEINAEKEFSLEPWGYKVFVR